MVVFNITHPVQAGMGIAEQNNFQHLQTIRIRKNNNNSIREMKIFVYNAVSGMPEHTFNTVNDKIEDSG